jgi:hypothetical protein
MDRFNGPQKNYVTGTCLKFKLDISFGGIEDQALNYHKLERTRLVRIDQFLKAIFTNVKAPHS